MDKRTKVKSITTILCLLLSIVTLYIFIFIFIVEVSMGWRIVLIIIAISWIISGILNLIEYLKETK